VLVSRPHLEPSGLRHWPALLHLCARWARATHARCEAIVDAMFGFELRREETDHLTRRSNKR